MFDHFFSRTASSSGSSGTEKHSENLVRLPTLSIPSFSGGAAEWTSFFAIFKSLVIENTAISNVERFHYLHSSLRGEAAELIKGLDITAENFEIAMQLLQERYENKRKAATIHDEKLMSLSTNQFPSAKNLRTLISTYREHVEALRVLGVLPANLEGTADGFFLFLIMVKKLDPTTRCNFERGLESNKDIPGPDTLIAFLEKECAALEASNDSNRNLRRPEIGRLTTTHMSQINRCLVCKQTDHAVYQCNAFLRQSVEQRRDFVQKNRLCFNCLRAHRAQNCSSETRCRHCKGKHHSLIHWSRFNQGQSGKGDASTSDTSQTKPEQSKDTEVRATSCTASLSPTGKHVLLSTVLVNVLNGQGNYETIRCLLDTGSQASYITTHCIQRLKLLYRKSDTRVLGLAQQGVRLREETEIHLTSRVDSQCGMTVQVLVLDKITGYLPTAPLSANMTRRVSNLKLTDPHFHIPGPIDCLLGADVFGKCLIEGRLEFGDDLPMAINTCFGWILMGSVGSEVSERTAESFVVTHHAVAEATVEQMLQRFWKIEEPECSDQVPLDDKICEEHYSKTVSRTSDGKYMVRLPFKQTSLKLGSSYHKAETRFLALEKRLSTNLEMYELYRKFMDEYLELNHMEPYEKPDPRSDTFNHYYLPHHGVLKPSSSTTKLRVVYDASCKTMLDSGCSLNDLLFPGPKLQKDITEILVHFRTHRVAMTADIRQMFRCVWVDPRDQNYQLILWRNSADEEL